MSLSNDNIRELNYRTCIPYYILFDLDLTSNHLRFYGIIEQMESNPNPKVNPEFSYAWIANILGIEKRQAIYIGKLLKEKKYVVHTQSSSGKWLWSTFKTKLIQEENEQNDDMLNELASAVGVHPPSAVPLHPPRAVGVHPKYHKDKYPKEINTTTSSSEFFEDYKKAELSALENLSVETDKHELKQKFKAEALEDEKCIAMFKKRFANTDVTLERLYEDCCDYWSQKGQMVFKARFLGHLSKCPVSNYPEKESIESEKRPKQDRSVTQKIMEYSLYVSKIKGDIALKLISEGSVILSFEEWNQTPCTG